MEHAHEAHWIPDGSMLNHFGISTLPKTLVLEMYIGRTQRYNVQPFPTQSHSDYNLGYLRAVSLV